MLEVQIPAAELLEAGVRDNSNTTQPQRGEVPGVLTHPMCLLYIQMIQTH